MPKDAPEVQAAKEMTARAADLVAQARSYQRMDPGRHQSLESDLRNIQQALERNPLDLAGSPEDPYALSLAGPADLLRRRQASRLGGPEEPAPASTPGPGPSSAATQTLAPRTGALIDEVDFPGFVASLIKGTWDALTDASIRQMEAYASLVSAVSTEIDQFTSENVTDNQVRDWLVERYPGDIQIDNSGGNPRLRARATVEGDSREPPWLQEYGLEGEEFTDELLEDQVIPLARRSIGEQRLRMLATMVLLGMNRIVVQDGSISAKVRFRAAASDRARVVYAQASDPGGGGNTWGSRGTFNQASMMVSTVGANVQADSDLKAELFGEVRINFASETLPLTQFADSAQMLLIQRNTAQNTDGARPTRPGQPGLTPEQSQEPTEAPGIPLEPQV